MVYVIIGLSFLVICAGITIGILLVLRKEQRGSRRCEFNSREMQYLRSRIRRMEDRFDHLSVENDKLIAAILRMQKSLRRIKAPGWN